MKDCSTAVSKIEPLEGRKIPSGGFFSFIKTDIVEDKYFEKRANFGLESDNMSLGANR